MSTSRSASRSARTATSSLSRGRPLVGRRRGSRRHVRALRVEIGLRADAARRGVRVAGRRRRAGRAPLETVYLGGGTPTLLPSAALAAILDPGPRAVRDRGRRRGDDRGQPRPGRTGRPARALVAAGFNRLSLGAQAMDAALLQRLGRRHRPGDVAAAVAEARAAGFALRLAGPAVRRAGAVGGCLGRHAGRGAALCRPTTCPPTR